MSFKNEKMNIGIIGNGFVGSSVAFGFSEQCGVDFNIRVYDKDKTKSTHELKDVLDNSDFIFVSVPTPCLDSGKINLTIVYSIFKEISMLNRRDNIILLRSTVSPGTTRKLSKIYKNLNIVFNPEFLTERSAKFDFINPSRQIFGFGENMLDEKLKLESLFKFRFGYSIPIINTSYETAELIKYMNNCFFATKISFLNEMKLVCEKLNADWDDAVEGFLRDGRIGHSHYNVPGHDGKKGFGGACFPKDMKAMSYFCNEIGVNSNVIDGAIKTNNEVRPNVN